MLKVKTKRQNAGQSRQINKHGQSTKRVQEKKKEKFPMESLGFFIDNPSGITRGRVVPTLLLVNKGEVEGKLPRPKTKLLPLHTAFTR